MQEEALVCIVCQAQYLTAGSLVLSNGISTLLAGVSPPAKSPAELLLVLRGTGFIGCTWLCNRLAPDKFACTAP